MTLWLQLMSHLQPKNSSPFSSQGDFDIMHWTRWLSIVNHAFNRERGYAGDVVPDGGGWCYQGWSSPAGTSGRTLVSSARWGLIPAVGASGRSGSDWSLEEEEQSEICIVCRLDACFNGPGWSADEVTTHPLPERPQPARSACWPGRT